MKCIYYLTSTLTSTHQISDDLHEAGISDWFFHVISKNESGLKKEHIHSSNYLETLDIIRDGCIGAMVGLLVGVMVSLFVKAFGPDEVPSIIYFIIPTVLVLFGAWTGGLVGTAHENNKISKFHDEIEAGKYLILIYARQEEEETVKAMMTKKHTEAKLVAIDTHLLNPFSTLKRV